MFTGLPRHVHPVDIPESVKKLYSVGFVAALDGTPTLWNPALPRRDPLHLWGDRQQIVSPVVFALGAAERDATWRVNGGGDLARMDRVAEDGGTHEDRAHAVCVHTSGLSDLVGGRELGVWGQWDAKPGWRGLVVSGRRRLRVLRFLIVKVEVKTLIGGMFLLAIVTVAKGAGEASRLGFVLRFRELVLRRGFEAGRARWIWEAGPNARERLVANVFWVRGVGKKPRVVARLLHGALVLRMPIHQHNSLDQRWAKRQWDG